MTEGLPPRTRDGRVAAAVFALAFLVYNANLRYVGSFDSYATSLLPFRILGGHGLTLADPSAMPELTRYSIVRARDGKWRSFYPIATSLLVTPLYAPAALLIATGVETDVSYLRVVMDKVAASILAALSAAVMFLVLRRLTSRAPALWLTAAWAFGTGTWAISSQALWQESASGLFVALALLVLVRRGNSWVAPALLGLCAGVLAANRPTDVLFTLAFLGAGFRVWGRRGAVALVPVAVLGALTLTYNFYGFAHLLGAYGNFRGPGDQALGASSTAFYGLEGLYGLLLSNRGLLPWSPFLVVAAFGIRRGQQRLPGALFLAAAFVASLVLHGRHYDWMGGYCYGPRYALHGLGAVIAMLATPLERVWKGLAGRVAFSATVLFSAGLQATGALCFPGNDSGNERHRWDFASSSPVRAWQAGPQQPNFLGLLRRSPMPANPLGPSDAAVRYEWEVLPPPSWPSDGVRTVQLLVTNRGGMPWSSVGGRLGRGGVLWHIRWVYATPQGPVPSLEEIRWAFFRLEPGESRSCALTVLAPPFEGHAVLEIGLTQTAYSDFETLGTPPLRTAVHLDPFPG